jgi:hypothetical protein
MTYEYKNMLANLIETSWVEMQAFAQRAADIAAGEGTFTGDANDMARAIVRAAQEIQTEREEAEKAAANAKAAAKQSEGK